MISPVALTSYIFTKILLFLSWWDWILCFWQDKRASFLAYQLETVSRINWFHISSRLFRKGTKPKKNYSVTDIWAEKKTRKNKSGAMKNKPSWEMIYRHLMRCTMTVKLTFLHYLLWKGTTASTVLLGHPVYTEEIVNMQV